MEVHSRVMEQVCRLFDVPVIQNNLRGLYVELLVAELLGEGWKLASGDWAAWDIEHKDGTRLEVKQSAATQTWSAPDRGASAPSFSIRTPKFTWVGAERSESSVRPANIYVFAWHDGLEETADQRSVDQWQFFVVETRQLPEQKSIGLNPLRLLVDPVSAAELRTAVEKLRHKGTVQ